MTFTFEHFDIYLKTFWYIAIPVTAIFLIQAILTIAGGGDGEVHVDTELSSGHSYDLLGLFSLRNIIHFLLGFSWGGICFYHTIDGKTELIFAAIVTGIIFVSLFFYIIKQLKKLEENNTFDIGKVVGLEADVYLKIPDAQAGKGKISVSYKGSNHELEAMAETIGAATGDKVLILDVLADNVLLVSPLSKKTK
jgi:hypothetical protein